MTWRQIANRCLLIASLVVYVAAHDVKHAEAADESRILVFAAASLTHALVAIGEAYAKQLDNPGAPKLAFSFAGSSVLARQIENGAPAALYFSADEQWMDYLAARNLIVPASRESLLGNRLVLITPRDRQFPLDIHSGFPLAQALNGGRLVLADPDAVPAGRYARAALQSLGAWKGVEKNIVRADNVRSALTFVDRGEVAAGIVYATDAALSRNVAVIGTFPTASHPRISYPLSIVTGHDIARVRVVRDFLLSDIAKSIFRKFGFSIELPADNK